MMPTAHLTNIRGPPRQTSVDCIKVAGPPRAAGPHDGTHFTLVGETASFAYFDPAKLAVSPTMISPQSGWFSHNMDDMKHAYRKEGKP